MLLGHHFGCSGLRFGRFSCMYSHRICALLTLGDAVCSIIPAIIRCLPGCLVFVVFAMASWCSKLVEQGVQESVADAIIKLGYDTEELFRSAFIDQAAFEGWLAKLRSKLGNTEWAALDAEDWATHPAAARIRLFWKNGLTLPALQASPGSLVAGSSLALVPVGSSSKLTPSDREKMKCQLENDYSSVFVAAETMPALCYCGSGFPGVAF